MPKQLIERIVGAAVGVVVGLSFLFLGFWETVLLLALGSFGWWLCSERHIPDWLISLIDRIDFRRR